MHLAALHNRSVLLIGRPHAYSRGLRALHIYVCSNNHCLDVSACNCQQPFLKLYCGTHSVATVACLTQCPTQWTTLPAVVCGATDFSHNGISKVLHQYATACSIAIRLHSSLVLLTPVRKTRCLSWGLLCRHVALVGFVM